ncbi:metal-dependent hydrolase [Candidatus Pacearchaeota archaeon]|nr:metal-dependent hydrolase [Candidatus Pacearchaeota archaeon]
MLFRSHIVFSLFLYLIILRFFELDFASKVVFGIFLFLATILVDLDSRNSKIGNHWYLRPLQWIFSHRGALHSLLFCFIFSFLVFSLDKNAGIGFLAGYLSHLFLDLLTRQGLFLFWPFSKKKISLLGLKTGGIFEEIFFVLVLLVDVALIFKFFV